ncbi:hypothetical protein LWM68_00650 [Niabella sp. W65]|nr:hypothetical protein [Niabella sp. W65]MCH7361419.1 hypothetical protein [Niabella sp. W65]
MPSWEKTQLNTYITSALKTSKKYFETVAATFATGALNDLEYKLSRKEAFIEQANLSGGFTRMMNEPKSKQGDLKKIHQMVVLIYTLNSHIVSLAGFARGFKNKYGDEDFHAIKDDITAELNEALSLIEHKEVTEAQHHAPIELKEELDELVSKRRLELQQGLVETETRKVLVEFKPVVDQFLFISRIAGDIKKLAKSF